MNNENGPLVVTSLRLREDDLVAIERIMSAASLDMSASIRAAAAGADISAYDSASLAAWLSALARAGADYNAATHAANLLRRMLESYFCGGTGAPAASFTYIMKSNDHLASCREVISREVSPLSAEMLSHPFSFVHDRRSTEGGACARRIAFRLDAADDAELQRRAGELGIDKSSYIRSLIHLTAGGRLENGERYIAFSINQLHRLRVLVKRWDTNLGQWEAAAAWLRGEALGSRWLSSSQAAELGDAVDELSEGFSAARDEMAETAAPILAACEAAAGGD